MGTTRTAWHVLLAALIAQRGSPGIELRTEVPLSTEPLRADYLLLRVRHRVAGGEGARTLRGLWALLPKQTLVEFKSAARPYRRRNLHRLWSYLHLHYADQHRHLKRHRMLSGVLLVPARTPSLDADARWLALSWLSLGGGYWRLLGGPFALIVGEIDRIAEAERDDLLRLFCHDRTDTPEGRRWLAEQLGAEEIEMAMHELEGYEEVVDRLIARMPPEKVLKRFGPTQRLAGLTPEERLAGLAPKDRLAGLGSEEVLLTLPDAILRGLSEEVLAGLSEATRTAVRARTGR